MKLIDYLPEFYRGSVETTTLEEALDRELEKLWAVRGDFFAQLNVSSATWGLKAWEAALGLETDVSKSVEYRRTRVLSKLRGQGTTTAAMIRNVAESFSNGVVDVIEHPEEARFEVKFTGTIGIPPNLEDLSAAIDEIKPAHLAYTYIILFRTWGDVRQRTWGALAAHTWAAVKEGAI